VIIDSRKLSLEKIKNYNFKSFYIFDEKRINFLSHLSRNIISYKNIKQYPDLLTFGYWCRNANIRNKDNLYNSNKNIKVGRGLAFQITPSNVPTNFLYSFAISLLAGNSNIIKIPNKRFEQIKIFDNILETLFKIKEYEEIRNTNLFIEYDSKETEVTKQLSLICDVRVIWGSDETVTEVKKFAVKPTTVDITFSDKYSLCILNLKNIENLNKSGLDELSFKLFKDIFLMDQNACSSPHLIILYGTLNSKTKMKLENLWINVSDHVNKGNYEFDNMPVEKLFIGFESLIINKKNIKSFEINNNVYRNTIKKLPDDITDLRGKYGNIFLYNTKNLKNLKNYFTKKIQTITYFGFEDDFLKKELLNEIPKGIDRIVPVGTAIDMDINWDGYNLIDSLSRNIIIN
jgi:hypothetical protein